VHHTGSLPRKPRESDIAVREIDSVAGHPEMTTMTFTSQGVHGRTVSPRVRLRHE